MPGAVVALAGGGDRRGGASTGGAGFAGAGCVPVVGAMLPGLGTTKPARSLVSVLVEDWKPRPDLSLRRLRKVAKSNP